MLVGVTFPRRTDEDTEASLDELAAAGRHRRRRRGRPRRAARDAPDHTWFIGKGKAEELREVCLAVDADTVVFDNELTPAQQYNLEKLLGRTAIDRTAVILDIFAQNAHTLEGKAQVELALLRYRLPRLRRGASARCRSSPAASAPAGGRRDAARGRPPPHHAAHREARGRTQGARRAPAICSARARPQRAGHGVDRRLHERRQVDACSTASPTPACWSEDRLFATLDPTTRRLRCRVASRCC